MQTFSPKSGDSAPHKSLNMRFSGDQRNSSGKKEMSKFKKAINMLAVFDESEIVNANGSSMQNANNQIQQPGGTHLSSLLLSPISNQQPASQLGHFKPGGSAQGGKDSQSGMQVQSQQILGSAGGELVAAEDVAAGLARKGSGGVAGASFDDRMSGRRRTIRGEVSGGRTSEIEYQKARSNVGRFSHSNIKSQQQLSKSIASDYRKSIKSIQSVRSSLKQSIRRHPLMSEDHIYKYKQLFDKFDVDKGGTIDLRELKDMLKSVGQDLNEDELREIIADFDEDGSGEIDFEEFLQIFMKLIHGFEAQEDSNDQIDQDITHEEIDPITGHLIKMGGRYANIDPEQHIGPIIFSEHQIRLKPTKPKGLKLQDKTFHLEPKIDWDCHKDFLDKMHPREHIEDPDAFDDGRSNLSTYSSRQKKKLVKFSYFGSNIGRIGIGSDPSPLNQLELEIGLGLTIYFRHFKLLLCMLFLFLVVNVPIYGIQFVVFQNTQAKQKTMEFQRITEIHPLSFYKNNYLFPWTLPFLSIQDFFCYSLPISEILEKTAPNPFLVFNNVTIEQQTQKGNSQNVLGPVLELNVTVNKANQSEFNQLTAPYQIKCHQGQIQNLIEFGLSTQDSRCPSQSMDDALIQEKLIQTISVDPECSFRNFEASAPHTAQILNHFATLKNKSEGIFQVNLTGMFPENCYQKMIGLNFMKEEFSAQFDRPELYMLVQCYEQSFLNPLTFQEDLGRMGLLVIVLLADVAVVFIYMVCIVFLKKITLRTLCEFQEFNNKFEVRDFAIQVTNLPKIKDYKNQEILKALLFDHFERIAENQPQQIKCLQRSQRYHFQIVDVFFGKNNYGYFKNLIPIRNLFEKIAYYDVLEKNLEKDYSQKKIKLEQKIDKLKNRFVKKQTKLYERSQKVSFFRSQIRSRCSSENIQAAYVVFRSMEGRARALKAYEKLNKEQRPWYVTFLFKTILCPFICIFRTYKCLKRCFQKKQQLTKQEEQDQSLLFMEKFNIKVEPAENPEHIQWNNYTTNCCSRCCIRSFKGCLFLFLFLLYSLIFLIKKMVREPFLERYPEYRVHQLRPHNSSKVIPIEMVMNDYTNGTLSWQEDIFKRQSQVGYVFAYCEFMTLILNKDVSQIKFPGKDKTEHCFEIQQHFAVKEQVDQLHLLLLVFLLPMVLQMSNCLGWCLCKKTTQEKYAWKIQYAVYLSYFMFIILLILGNLYTQVFAKTPFEVEIVVPDIVKQFGLQLNNDTLFWYDVTKYRKLFPLLRGQFTEFNGQWHLDVGLDILLAFTVYVPLSMLHTLWTKCICRKYSLCYDRHCCKHNCCCLCCRWTKTKGTKQYTQHELNQLYLGEEFDIAFAYQQMHIILWICLSLSSSMPVFYAIAFIFLLFKFMIEKYMILYLCKKPTTFDEKIAQKQLKMLQIPIFLHVIFSILNYSSSSLFFDANLSVKQLGLQNEYLNDYLPESFQPQNNPQSAQNFPSTIPSQAPLQNITSHPLAQPTSPPTSAFLPFTPRQLPLPAPSPFFPQPPPATSTDFLSLHMWLLYTAYVLTVVAYKAQEKIEQCMRAFCAKCRGDGLYNDYDSEVEEEELRKMDENCNECLSREARNRQMKDRVRQVLGIEIKDNNQLGELGSKEGQDDGADGYTSQIFNRKKRYPDSSDEDDKVNQVGKGGQADGEADELVGHDIEYLDSEEEERQLKHYSDDFFRELPIEYLFYYYDLNNFELQRAIQALTYSANFNTFYNLKSATKYVGESYDQHQMKQVVGLFKRRRMTFKRRFIQIMKKMNKRVSIYLSFGQMGGNDSNALFLEQLSLMRRIMIKSEHAYDKDEPPDKKYKALNSNSWRQKQILMHVGQKGRLKQKMQSYDVFDKEKWKGTMTIMKMLLPEMKSDLMSSVIQNPNKKLLEKKLQETVPEVDEDAQSSKDDIQELIDGHFELAEFADEEEGQHEQEDKEQIGEFITSELKIDPSSGGQVLSFEGIKEEIGQENEDEVGRQIQQEDEAGAGAIGTSQDPLNFKDEPIEGIQNVSPGTE